MTERLTALDIPEPAEADLSPAMQAYFARCRQTAISYSFVGYL